MSEDTRTTLRLPEDMKRRLTAAAIRHRRSDHAQILTYIELGLTIDEGTISTLELAVLNDPRVRAAVSEARTGDRTQLRSR